MRKENEVSLKAVSEEDIRLIYELRNDPAVRKTMFQGGPIAWGEHAEFWRKRLADRDALSFMVVLGGRKIGFARLDKRDDGFEVGIIVSPEMQGQGIGTRALGAVISLARQKGMRLLIARVKPGNAASAAIFIKNGFVEKNGRYELEL